MASPAALRTFASAAFAGAVVAFSTFAALALAFSALAGHIHAFGCHLDGGRNKGVERGVEAAGSSTPHAQQTQRRI